MKGHMFEGANRGKKSIVLDMKAPGAASVIERLAACADVAIEGFRPPASHPRLGFGPDQLQAINGAGLLFALGFWTDRAGGHQSRA